MRGQDLDGIFKQVSSSSEQLSGLSSAQATQLLKVHGPNDPTPTESRRRFAVLAAFASNPLIAVLIVAAGISFSIGERVDATLVITIVLFSVVLDTAQNLRSEAAVKRLQSEIAPKAEVLRDGNWVEIPRIELVPGDVIRLDAGDLIPADCRLIQERDLHVQEAALTGESLPVEKEVGGKEEDEWVYLGTAVVSGTAVGKVFSTGPRTRFGAIARDLQQKAPPTEFERGLTSFGQLIMRVVVVLCAFVFLVLVLFRREPLESLLFAVALAVGLTPEFLPMITTLTLARGAVRMSREKVIVKNLASIQNFGSIDILCSDKTGTLTSGEMKLERLLDAQGDASDDPIAFAKLNALFHTGTANPLDKAIIDRAGDDADGYQKVDEVPFDFERRRASVVVEREGARLLICKGASEGVLPQCGTLSAGVREKVADLETEGFRVLAVAVKTVSNQASYSPDDETDMRLVGFLGFADPPLPGALQILNSLAEDGLQVKVITGDSEAVARHVCTQIGLQPGKIGLGEEIERLSEADLSRFAEEGTVFARVNPAQKNKLILALKKKGHVVGYMGDGINDAPSLHSADIGISFAGATDVAKDAAQIILTERNLEVLHKGVLEGRIAFGNVMKYILMGTSSNFGNMFSMAAAALFLPFLPMLPTQILLNNLLYDLAQVSIPTDHVDDADIHKPKRWDVGLIRDFMLFMGPISSIFDFLTFSVLLYVFHADEKFFHTGWFVESLATQTLVIFVIRTRLRPWASRPSHWLVATVLFIVVVGALLPISPVSGILGFRPLPPAYLAFVVVATVAYLGIVEVLKGRIMDRMPATR